MKIAWIGLGNMGTPMASRLKTAGHDVTGFDVSEKATSTARDAGMAIADDIAATVRGAEVVFLMLPSHHVVDAVLSGPDGVIAHAQPGTLIVDSSTIDIEAARTFHSRATEAGLRFLDAPVSGGISGAAAGTLAFMVGGDPGNLEFARPVIEPMASRILHTGGPGTGQAAKICNNLVLGVALAATCEAAVLAERLGLSAKTFYDVASVSSGDNWALRTWYPIAGVTETAAVNRNFEGGFSTDLLLKDLGLALKSGEFTATPLPFASAVRNRMQQLSDAGYGDRDCSVLVGMTDGTLSVPHDLDV